MLFTNILTISLLFVPSLVFSAGTSMTPAFDLNRCPEVLSCSSENPGHQCCTHRHGIIKLALQWMPGYGPPDAFTIHGLWPNKCLNGEKVDSRTDPGCNPKRVVKKNVDLSNLLNPTVKQDLDTYWPSNKNSNAEFWAHEWNSHGICYSPLDEQCGFGLSEAVSGYFQTALTLRSKYSFYRTLTEHQIPFDGSDTTVEKIQDVAMKILGLELEVFCWDGSDVIFEIRTTFKVKGRNNFVPYLRNKQPYTNCRGKKVRFPTKDGNPDSPTQNSRSRRRNGRSSNSAHSNIDKD